MPLGIYHNPGIWFGERQFPLESTPIIRFDEVVTEREFAPITISVSRDGLFAFDFSKWPEHRESLVERRKKQIEIMNSYLLCFYCAVATRGLWIEDFRQSMPMMRADHNNILGIPTGAYGGIASGGLSDDMLRVTTRRLILDESGAFFPLYSLPEKVLNISFDLFGDLWRSADMTVFTFSDLLLGAHVAHFNLRFAEALALGWLLIETFLDMIWKEFIKYNRRRNGKTFINNDRKNTLETGREYTASVRIEILSLLDEVSYELYLRLNTARQKRNRWIHQLVPPTPGESAEAIQLAERLFRDRFDFDTTLPPHAGSTFISGGEYLDETATSINVPLRDFTLARAPIHTAGLDKEIRQVLGDNTVGISVNGQLVKVHLRADAPPELDEIAQQIIEVHDPAFLKIDGAHSSLPGEHKFDSQRHQPHVIGNGEDEAIVNIELPHTKKFQVVVLHNKEEYTVNLEGGIGQVKITSVDPPGTRILLSVQGHPCDPLEIEVIAAP